MRCSHVKVSMPSFGSIKAAVFWPKIDHVITRSNTMIGQTRSSSSTNCATTESERKIVKLKLAQWFTRQCCLILIAVIVSSPTNAAQSSLAPHLLTRVEPASDVVTALKVLRQIDIGDNPIRTLEIDPNGECAIVLTANDMRRYDASGTLIWVKPYLNRWLKKSLSMGIRLQIAPACAWFLLVGNSSNKAAWRYSGNGTLLGSHSFSTTPRGVAISPDGQYWVIGTGAATVQRYHFDTLKNTTRIDGSAERLEYSPDGQLLLTIYSHGNAYLFDASLNTLWTRSGPLNRVVTDSNWQRFLFSTTPWHGVDLGESAVLDRSGKTLYSSFACEQKAQFADHEQKILVTAANEFNSDMCYNEFSERWLDRNGKLIDKPLTIPVIDQPNADRCAKRLEILSRFDCFDHKNRAVSVENLNRYTKLAFAPNFAWIIATFDADWQKKHELVFLRRVEEP